MSMTRAQGAIAGLVCGALAVGVGMLAAALTGVASPIDAVGSEVIDAAPRWLKELAIQWFGTADKVALRIGIIVLLAIAAALLGAAAVRRPWAGVTGFALFGVIGALAGSVVPSLLGALVGGWALHRLTAPRPVETPGPSQAPLGWDRRRFLVASGATAVAAAAAGGLATALEGRRVGDLRAATRAPLPGTPPDSLVNRIPAGATLAPDTPYLTPNGDFYRIDTALSFPRVDVATWKLDITGMVDTPLSFTYDDLLAMPQEERVVTLCCVSNEVGGKYIGNAVWQGVMLRDLLEQAGVQPGAEQVFSTSLDGWTCGFPAEAALDGRDAMLVVGMNGAILPLEHGYPVRLVVPGLYGYVSATKWLRSIELTTWDREGYWVPRGWSRLGPIKTQSRIDVPRANATVTAGPQKIAGVAWAQHTGILAVEVRVDDGEWQPARLATDVSDDAWRQWVLDWDAPAGDHKITVRATDKTGATQTEERRPVAPDGATGWHAIRVKVQ